MATKKIKTITIDPLASRVKDGSNQSKYWSRLGVTQSGGSRYESGRNIPKPVRMLIALADGKATIDELRDGTLSQKVGK